MLWSTARQDRGTRGLRGFGLSRGDAVAAEDASARSPVVGRLLIATAGIYIFTVPFDGLSIFSGRSLPFMASMLMVACALGEFALGRNLRHVRFERVLASAFVLLVFGTASYFWSLDPGSTLFRVVTQVFLYAVTICVAICLADRPGLIWCFLVGCVALVPFILSAPEEQYTGRRTFAGNENDVATALATGFSIAVYMAVSRRGMRQLVAVAAAAAVFVAIIATGSRSLTLGAALVVPLAIVTAFRRRPFRAIAVAALAGALFLVGRALVPSTLVPSRLSGMQTATFNGDLSGREEIWHAAWQHGLSLLGVGWGAAPTYYLRTIGEGRVTHDFFLGVLLELGVMGVVLWAWLIVAACRAARRGRFAHLLLLLSPVVIVSGLTLTLDARRIFWFFVALAWAGAVSFNRDRALVLRRSGDGVTR